MNYISLLIKYECAEKRAEKLEARVKELEAEQAQHDEQIAAMESKFNLAMAGLRSKTARCEKVEEQLKRLKAQEPVDFRWRWARDENAPWT